MLPEDYSVNKGQAAATGSALDRLNFAAPEKSARVVQLRTALVFYATIEFFAVTSSAYFASAFYHYFSFNSLQAKPAYVLAAVIIGTLVLVISIAFQNYVAFRRQARHIFLWRGIGAVSLAFSIFLTILF